MYLSSWQNKCALGDNRCRHTSPSEPRTVTRYTTVTLPVSEKITSRISPHQPEEKKSNVYMSFKIRNPNAGLFGHEQVH